MSGPTRVEIAPSLYGVLHGQDPVAPALLAILNEAAPIEIPRFRDASLNADGTEIVVRTRTGGGNRDCVCGDGDPGMRAWTGSSDLVKNAEGHYPNCYPWMNGQMARHPLYVRDEDDDFDSTYAYFHFRVPERHVGATGAVATGVEPPRMGELTDRAIDRIRSMTPEELESDPALGPTTRALKRALGGPGKKEEGGPGVG